MTKTPQYEVNFFKALTEHAKKNRNLILTLAIIWAVAVFGFQFLLMALNKPTPEKAHGTFESVWPQVMGETATPEMKQEFSRVLLSVLGKNIALKAPHKSVLTKTLSWTLYSMQDEENRALFQREPDGETIQAAINSIGLAPTGMDKIMIDLLPLSLVQVDSEALDAETKNTVPGIMDLYLIHNRNALTDMKFIGFPFHYWYTAQFLLIMFVVLCLIYAISIDRLNEKYDFVEET